MTGPEIRARRKALGLRQIDLADKALLSRDTIRNVEAGKHAAKRHRTTLERIARVLAGPKGAA